MRPAAPAEPGVALVDGGDHARLTEPVGTGETGESRADDGDARRGDRPEPAHHVRHAGEGDAGRGAGTEKIAPADPVARVLLQDRFYGPAGGGRFAGDAERMDELLEYRGMCHAELRSNCRDSISSTRSQSRPAPHPLAGACRGAARTWIPRESLCAHPPIDWPESWRPSPSRWRRARATRLSLGPTPPLRRIDPHQLRPAHPRPGWPRDLPGIARRWERAAQLGRARLRITRARGGAGEHRERTGAGAGGRGRPDLGGGPERGGQ